MSATLTRALVSGLMLAAAGPGRAPELRERAREAAERNHERHDARERYEVEERREAKERRERLERRSRSEARPVKDDPRARALALKELWGPDNAAAQGYFQTLKARERRRWAHTLPGAGVGSGANAWLSLGPEDAFSEFNESDIDSVDSGRPTAIVVDPRDPNIVYVALAGGGIWKSYDFVTADPEPSWIPVGEELPALAVGALALDPTDPDTLYAALGDAFDQGGNGVFTSTNGGASWSGPVELQASGSARSQPSSARDLKVDPAHPNRIFVATDAGLFVSNDRAATFSLVDLPFASSGYHPECWSIVQTGATSWIVSAGQYDQSYNFLGDLFISQDSGQSWSSLGAAGALPANAASAGRMTLAAGNPARAGGAAVYVFAGNNDGSATLGYWRSLDGGRTWADATGYIANPTQDDECSTTDVAHDQAWYNQAIAVDPTNDDNVIVGGNLCSMRTLSGTASSPRWENASVWLQYFSNRTTNGLLPYVHADWHAAIIVAAGGVVRAIAGTDGGIFSSKNLFDPNATPGDRSANPVVWASHNKGLVTHLAYTVGSGDPAQGNPEVVIMGLQDNGTRLRVPTAPTTFNQVVGGDGLGTAVGKGTAGEFYWGSVVTNYPGAYQVCVASSNDCTLGGSWQYADPPVSPDQFAQFSIRYDRIATDPSGAAFLTNTVTQVWKSDASLRWSAASPDFSPSYVRDVRASQTVPNLYGASMSGGLFAVTSDGVTWTTSSQLGAQGETLTRASSMDFPPQTPSGANPGDVYLASTATQTTESGQVVPDALGHLFITHDRGQSWEPLHGDGSGFDLPNVPIFSIRYDPSDLTNSSIYVGTDFGVYRTTDAGRTWERFGSGLPLVRVTYLSFASNGSVLRIATYGRGVWEVYPTATAWRGVAGDGDFDRNLALDYRDLGALASRMGTDPSTGGWPTYSWILDVAPGAANPPLAAIDDDDLAAFLAKFGGHP